MTEKYLDCIEVFESQKALMEMSIVSTPNMKNEDRRKFHKTLHKKAYPDTHNNKRPVDTRELARLIGAGKI